MKKQLLFNVPCSGRQDLTIPHFFKTSGSRGISEAERILLRIVEEESDLELSEDEVEEGQREEEVESSEEDTAAIEEPEPEKSNEPHSVLWMSSNV